ncbi:hypothetical protein [Glycomyces tenuis]|nr:hypothetical protein [Glycomyces tenuis]
MDFAYKLFALAHLQIRGEWFGYADDIKEHIEQLGSQPPPS